LKFATVVLISSFLLTGCSAIFPERELDVDACTKLSEKLSQPDALTGAAIGSLASVAAELRSEVIPLASEGLAERIEALAAELEATELKASEIVAIGSEIALRCAIVGVTIELPEVSSFLG
jgi:hypothetical protein